MNASTTFEVIHRTHYDYDEHVSRSHGLAYLLPRATPWQEILSAEVVIDPVPGEQREHVDHLGNRATYFDVHARHDALDVRARSLVRVLRRSRPVSSPAWDQVRDTISAVRAGSPQPVKAAAADELVDACEFSVASPKVKLSAALADYARPSFPAGRAVVDAVVDLNARIFTDFRFDPKATTVSTPTDEVLEARAGVCQDFAHVMIGGLRALGIPARYVSGYLETVPPPGVARLQGADASHAWVQAWCGPAGWLDVDPTNNLLVDDRHVTVAWGRDFDDVVPLKGVIFTDAKKNTLTVEVDVLRQP